MEQVQAREQVVYAGLGWRMAAIAVDTMVLFFLLVVVFAFLAAAGALDLKDPAYSGGIDLQRSAPVWMYLVTYGLIFVYYTILETLTAASVGKLVFRMRVTMDDGTRPSGVAVVVRNLIRLPEVLFWYIPAGISCLASPRNKRLGDLAARTVVVRRGATPATVSGVPARSWPGGASAPAPPGLASAAPSRAPVAPGLVTGPPAAVADPGGARCPRRAQDGGARGARGAPQLPALLRGGAGEGGGRSPRRTGW